FAGGVFTALRMSALVGADHRHFERLMQKVNRIVAVCSWVADVLRLNGVPEAKLAICRQGLSRSVSSGSAVSNAPRDAGMLRLGYFGRLDRTKGVDLLIEALRLVPDAKVRLDVYGVIQPGSEAYAARLKCAAVADQRVSMHPALPATRVVDAMRAYDL